jgi:hypothetical protein
MNASTVFPAMVVGRYVPVVRGMAGNVGVLGPES